MRLSGLSKGKSLKSFDQKQLRLGCKVELEHENTRSKAARRRACRVAADHLVEHPRYYTKLIRAGLRPVVDARGPRGALCGT